MAKDKVIEEKPEPVKEPAAPSQYEDPAKAYLARKQKEADARRKG